MALNVAIIDPYWETERLILRDAVEDDAPELQRVLESIRDTLRLEGKEQISSDEMRRMILEGSLPPGGTKERHRLQCVRIKETGSCVGYLTVYHGYPAEDVLYIGTLVIARQHQGNGFGSEVVKGLDGYSERSNYQKQRVWVALKNWVALKFWIRRGFREIIYFAGDSVSANEAHAGLELEKRIELENKTYTI